MATFADALIKFIGDFTGIHKQAADEGEKAGKGFGSAVTTGVKVASAAITGFAVTKFAEDALSAGSDLAAAMSRNKAIFGAASQSVTDWSKTTIDSMGLSETAALTYSNQVGKTLVGSMGMSGKAAADMSENVVKLAADYAAFNRVPTDQAMDAVTRAMMGQTRGLKELGVSISATDIDAKALTMGLGTTTVNLNKVKDAQLAVEKAQVAHNAAIKKYGENSTQAEIAAGNLDKAQRGLDTAMGTGKTTLTQAEKAQATYALMVERSGAAHGYAEKSMNTYAGQQKKLTATVEEAKAQLGLAMLPILAQFASIVNSVVIPAIHKLSDFFQDHQTVLHIVAIALSGLIILVSSFQVIATAAALATTVWTVAQGMWTAATWLATAAMTAFNLVMAANPIVLIVAGIVLLIGALVLLYLKFQPFHDLINEIGGAIAAFVSGAIAWLVNAFQTVVGWVQVVMAHWQILAGVLLVLLGPLGLIIAAIVLLVTHWQTVIGVVQSIPGIVAGALNAAWSAIVGFVANVGGFIAGLGAQLGGVKDRVLGAFAGAGTWLLDIGRQIIQGLIDGITSKIGDLTGALGKVTSLIPIHKGPPGEDAKLLFSSGSLIMGGLISGIESQQGALQSTLAGVSASIGGLGGAAAGAAAAAAPTGVTPGAAGPAMVIQEAHFHDEADVTMLSRKMEFAVGARSF